MRSLLSEGVRAGDVFARLARQSARDRAMGRSAGQQGGKLDRRRAPRLDALPMVRLTVPSVRQPDFEECEIGGGPPLVGRGARNAAPLRSTPRQTSRRPMPHHSTQDLLDAIEQMTPADIKRVHIYISTLVHKTPIFRLPKELLHEILYRHATGSRHWPVGVPIRIYLCQMRARASPARSRQRKDHEQRVARRDPRTDLSRIRSRTIAARRAAFPPSAIGRGGGPHRRGCARARRLGIQGAYDELSSAIPLGTVGPRRCG